MKTHVVTENEVRELAPRVGAGGRVTLPPGSILTPMARDYLRARGLDTGAEERPASAAPGKIDPNDNEAALIEAVAAEVARAMGGKAVAQPETSASRTTEKIMPERPQTQQAHSGQRAVVWAIGADKPGILAAVAELLGRRKINIQEISQTVLSGVFAMVMIVDLSNAVGAFGELKADLESVGREMGITLSAQRDDIFQYTQRI